MTGLTAMTAEATATETAATDMIESAVAYIRQERDQAPVPVEVVAALLAAEKQSKREKQRYTYEQLIGTWRLGFVSGTQTKRPKPQARAESQSTAGKGKPVKVVGKGRFLPRLVKITIAYAPATSTALPETTKPETATGDGLGAVTNSVMLGALKLQLQGPTRFWPKTNSLGFDFTKIQAGLGPLTLYNGAMRGGEARNQAFPSQTLKDQAFFTYFRVQPDCIAARGKGGGLALWVREEGS